MPLNVVIVNDFAHVNGGASQVAISSAAALAHRGVRVVFFSAVQPAADELRVDGLDVVCTRQYDILGDPVRLRAAVQGIWNRKAAGDMAKVLAGLDPDRTVVHLHSWTKALSSSVVRTVVRMGFRVVCTMHDYFLACPNGGFFLYPERAICRIDPLSWTCIRKDCDARSYSHKVWRVARQLVQRTAGLVPYGIRHYIAISDFSRGILEPYLGDEAEIYRVDNPVDVFPEEGPVDVEGNKAFIAVGRLSPEKGPLLFARAVAERDFEAVFVGDGPLRERIRESCPMAVLTGWLPRHEVMAWYRKARALVLPSLWYENQPLAVLQAKAMGVPAVVPDSSAARELVEDGVTGLWFEGGNGRDLADKICMLQDPALAGRMGRAAYDSYWAGPCTPDAHLAKLLNVYFRVLGCRSNAEPH